jgi:hypothetical protein
MTGYAVGSARSPKHGCRLMFRNGNQFKSFAALAEALLTELRCRSAVSTARSCRQEPVPPVAAGTRLNADVSGGIDWPRASIHIQSGKRQTRDLFAISRNTRRQVRNDAVAIPARRLVR